MQSSLPRDIRDVLRGLDMLNLKVVNKYQGKGADHVLLFQRFLLNEIPFLLGGAMMNVMSTAMAKPE